MGSRAAGTVQGTPHTNIPICMAIIKLQVTQTFGKLST